MTTIETPMGPAEAQLQQWGARIDALELEAQQAEAGAKLDYQRRLASLKAKHQAARLRVDEIRAAGSSTWDAIQAAIDSACAEIEVAYQQFTAPQGN